MLNIDENLNMRGVITEGTERQQKAIVAMNTNFANNGFTFSFSILDKESVQANKEDVQAQMDAFIKSIKNKMTELGYEITI